MERTAPPSERINSIIANYWSWRSQVYHTSCSRHPQWHEIFLAPFEGKTPLRLLDIGTGTGFLALGFAEAGHEVTGMDLSPGMLEVARKEAQKKGLSLEFLEGNALAPPFSEEEIFDGITCRNLLWTLPTPVKALREWKKLLKPGGFMILADGIWEPRLYLTQNEPVTKKFLATYKEIRSELPYFTGIDVSQGEALLEEAGFISPGSIISFFGKIPIKKKTSSSFFREKKGRNNLQSGSLFSQKIFMKNLNNLLRR